MPRRRYGYGTKRDRADPRDHYYSVARTVQLPDAVDLRAEMPPVYNQHHLNSCSAHAIAAALWFDARRRQRRAHSPSRLFIYYNERATEDVIDMNVPVSLRDGYKTVAKVGACAEPHWPYEVRRFRRKPLARCYEAAHEHRVIRYLRLRQSLRHMHSCLAEGFPFAVGLAVYKSFKSALVKRTGVVPIPERGQERCLGGHAMLVVGYMNDSRHFIVRNSYGKEWGDRGYCYLPYRYMLDSNLAWDFWTVRRVTTDA